MKLVALLPPGWQQNLTALTMLAALESHGVDDLDLVLPPTEELGALPPNRHGWTVHRQSAGCHQHADALILPVAGTIIPWLREELERDGSPVFLYVGELAAAPWHWLEAHERVRGLLTPDASWERLLQTAFPNLPSRLLAPIIDSTASAPCPAIGWTPYLITWDLTPRRWAWVLAEAYTRVLKAYPDIHLVVLGCERAALWSGWTHSTADRVHLLGPEAYRRAAELLGGAAITIAPPSPEGCSAALLTCLAHALSPVVVDLPLLTVDCHCATAGHYQTRQLAAHLDRLLASSTQLQNGPTPAPLAPRICSGARAARWAALLPWLQDCLAQPSPRACAPAEALTEQLYHYMTSSIASLGITRLPPGTADALARCVADLVR